MMSPDTSHPTASVNRLIIALDQLKQLYQEQQRLIKRWDKVLRPSGARTAQPDLDAPSGVPGDQEEISERLFKEIYQEITARTPLKVLLLGGSGVGKSTLLNTLAGRRVSSTSGLLRAHTSGLIIYTHRFWSDMSIAELAPSWPPSLLEVCERAEHDHEPLRNLWVIDAPDVDSSEPLHRARTLNALSEVDLPLVVTSPQNYRDESYISALKLIERRRSVLFVMNQMDLVWPEQRRALMHDAYALSDELEFEHARWIGVDARNDTVTSMTTPEDGDVAARKLPSSNTVGMESLRVVLETHLDRKEAERLRSGRLAQRLLKRLKTLRAPLDLYRKFSQVHQWRDGLIEELITPLSQCMRATYELRLLRGRGDIKVELVGAKNVWISAPLRLCWSLIVRGEYSADKVQRLTHDQYEHDLTCRATLLRYLNACPHHLSRADHHHTDLQSRVDRVIDAALLDGVVSQAHSLRLSRAEMTDLGSQHMSVSLMMSVVIGGVTSWNVTVMLIGFALTMFVFAHRALNELRSQQGIRRVVQPAFNVQAAELSLHLSHELLAEVPEWLRLNASHRLGERALDYPQLRADFERYEHHYDELSCTLSELLGNDITT